MSAVETREGRLFGILQRVGRSFMLPIALLPIAGLFLGVGSSLTNPATLSSLGLASVLGEGTVAGAALGVMSAVGSIVFDNLPILFAMGVALGMAEYEKATAVLSAAISFFVMHATIGSLLSLSGKLTDGSLPEGAVGDVCGIQSLEMGVFGGIIVGLGVAALHNKTAKIRLPGVISFFGGTRFVPIISTVAYTVVGGVMFAVWPYIQSGIHALGSLVLGSGYVGTLIYGLIERLLIPFGLHHVFYLPFWQTGLGGTAIIDGTLVSGAQNIFFAELASASTEVFSVSATRFMSGKFPVMIFGLPGLALAIWRQARPERRRAAGGLLLSAALTSMITGITEPLEFTFLFVAPSIYLIHSVLSGLSYMLMHILRVGVGMTFSGGIIDLFLFGVIQGQQKNNWLMILPVGAAYFAIYYLLFGMMIKKFDLPTPGREADGGEVRLYSREDIKQRRSPSSVKMSDSDGTADESQAALILRGLGGEDNIVSVDACATRLRVSVRRGGDVSDELLRQSGAAGVIRRGDGVQVVYGPQVSVIKSELCELLGRGDE